MKGLYTLITLFILSFGFSQETLEDFEAASASVTPFEGATASIVDDPVTSGGVNGKVAQGNSTSSGGQIWQGYTIALMTKNIDLTTDKTLTLDVYSTVSGEFAIKVQAGVDGAPASTKNAAHAGNGWENITVDFGSGNVDNTGAANGAYGEVVIFLNWDSMVGDFGTSVDKTFYVDNITGVGIDKSVALTPPATGPDTPPTRAAADVVSLFGTAYTRHNFGASGTFDAGWCGSPAVEEVTLDDGQVVVAYKGQACQGITFSEVDVSSFTNVSVDVFIDDSVDIIGKVFNLKFVNDPITVVKEVNINNGNGLVKGQWITLDFQVDLSSIDRWIEFGITSNVNDALWYTNLYAYLDSTASVENTDLKGLKLYPNPAKDTVRISAAESIDRLRIYDLSGRLVKQASPRKAAFSVDVSGLSKGVYLVKLNAGDREAITKMIK